MVKTWKPTVAGILSMVAGAVSVVIGLAAIVLSTTRFFDRYWLMGREMHFWGIGVMGIIALVLGIVAIIGGVFATRRRIWGLALTGAICALFPPPAILGILAIIFVTLGKDEFNATSDISETNKPSP